MPTPSTRGWLATGALALILCSALGLGLATLQPAPAASAVAPTAGTPHTVRYSRDIRPILSDRCFQCHGFDPATRHADLRLDLRDEAIAPRKNGAAIIPGDPDKSELIRRISSTDPTVAMPPADSHKLALSPEQRELFRRWIAEGATYEPHWAFTPPQRPELPTVKNASWARNPIDRFTLAAMEARGVDPSPEADKATLLRRIFLDLTGLPPTPQELDAFLADTRLDAYEQWIDKLMTEEPYRSRHAEHMAAPWLDQSRYADTCGIHMDAGRQMWLWRDWVLEAYRANMPFDQFVTEQLAGDLFPDATTAQKIASGFNRNHVTTDEGGAIAEEYLVEYAVDRSMTTGSVFLGLTVGCARCHDHKFDPISMDDFYSFYAFFNSIEEPGLYSQTPDVQRAYEPFITVPLPAQQKRLDEIAAQTADLTKKLDVRTPEEVQLRATFQKELWDRAGISWAPTTIVSATSTGGSTLEALPDLAIRASGTNPDRDDYIVTLRTDAANLRIITLEALPEPTAFQGRFGRSENGNVVVSGMTITAAPLDNPSAAVPVNLVWAWADTSQQDGDFDVTNILDEGPDGWALAAHQVPGSRIAVLLADKPFGFAGGTELKITLQHRSIYARHALARFRLGVGTINDAGLALLPTAVSRWYTVGPFPGDKEQNRVWEPEIGPEKGDRIDLAAKFGEQNLKWRFAGEYMDGAVIGLATGRNITYLAKHVYAPTPRSVPLSLGSDDGFRLYRNGEEVAQRKVERGVAPDQDKATLPLVAGRNAVVLKIVNTGGGGGAYYRASETPELPSDLIGTLLPDDRRSPELAQRVDRAWRMAHVPSVREMVVTLDALKKESAQITENLPRTMIMKELATPRETFVLTRGVYDKPDKARPVSRAVPKSLGKLPDGAPADRRGLAAWITSKDNPLLARVTVNRMWERAFGAGIVRTSEDFGLQGEFPTNPDLLDWLAVEFRDGGPDDRAWDVRHVLRLILTSATYRQSSTIRADLKDTDPDNRLLASFPRRRLTAEQIRDQALAMSGLLVEQLGGPSVKPYQPDGLWQEVAMIQSNTREYKRGDGPDLWRRSLYTYWKRAVPPPSMLTFDAPTRESCVTRRIVTNTPLQALVLWNDEQFLEAARVLAQNILAENTDDRARLVTLFKRAVCRAPDDRELAALERALADFKARYAGAPTDADTLVKIGMSPRPETISVPDLAAWTMICSAAFNLYETTTQE